MDDCRLVKEKVITCVHANFTKDAYIDITMQFEDHELTEDDFRPSSRRQPSQSSEGRFGVFESVDLSG